ncbi:MAG: methionine--tRNA ligase [Chloroflexi bacterium]|nr:methionine--tRNA ligase [Chloroflexota bacterium]MBS17256.1 methionine--tRNA ligase [Chloroflexota bacterium]MEC9098557.1 methionine--tRNA ligase [Chloroflexota bacterium]MQG23286.1 methionine--tRNA ligase [SAR202 cluster bacterium]|tara:strand:+ start:611 stop:2278 length:1668 start_codon:yes stop_codon:yes gene_type:complete
MKNKPKNILVCVAWPYVNGPPHLGHIAGMSIPADIFARYNRLIGNNVAMVSGSDMHGTPVTLLANDLGVTPEEISKKYHDIWSKSLKEMNFQYDLYTHTHTENHMKIVKDIFQILLEKKLLEIREQLMPFSVTENIFLSDRLVEGECPNGDNDKARGDQCDVCGRTLDPTDLGNIRSKRDGSIPEFRKTSHFFLRLSKLENEIRDWLQSKKDWRQNVKNQSLSFINEGLKDRAITRDLSWGVDIPVDGWEEKKIYVWFEAVLGYLSATVELFKNTKNPEMWKEFWEDENSESYYFQGKDNIPFHAIILPAILLGVENKNLPTEVVANEYLNFSGKEFSKSRNWAVWLPDFLEKYSADSLRYYLTSIMPETSDSDFTWEGYVSSNNNELVANLGNFIHRILTMSHKNFDGKIPKFESESESTKEIIERCNNAIKEVGTSISKRRFREALNNLMALSKFGNQFLDKNEPWKKMKENKNEAGEILGQSIIIINAISCILEPFLPESSQKLQKILFGETINEWKLILPKPGTPFEKPMPLFEKLDEEVVLEENRNSLDE